MKMFRLALVVGWVISASISQAVTFRSKVSQIEVANGSTTFYLIDDKDKAYANVLTGTSAEACLKLYLYATERFGLDADGYLVGFTVSNAGCIFQPKKH